MATGTRPCDPRFQRLGQLLVSLECGIYGEPAPHKCRRMRPGSRGGDRACEGSLPTPERSCVSRFCPRAIISLSRLCIPAQAKNRQGRRHPLAPRPSLHPAGLGRWERGPEVQGRVWGASVADTGVCWAWGGWAPSLGYPPQGPATSRPPPPRVGGNRRRAGRLGSDAQAARAGQQWSLKTTSLPAGGASPYTAWDIIFPVT